MNKMQLIGHTITDIRLDDNKLNITLSSGDVLIMESTPRQPCLTWITVECNGKLVEGL